MTAAIVRASRSRIRRSSPSRRAAQAAALSPGIASYDAVTVRFGAGIDATLEATTRRHLPIPLPHSGPGRYDSNAMSHVEMHGQRGFGVMEWAATFSDAEAAALGAVAGAGTGGEGGTWS